MLELACDLELPAGGDNWHRLRDGILPEEFTRGLSFLRTGLTAHPFLHTSSDVSPQLIGVLSQMMHPQPEQRPSARELLRHSRVQWAVWRGHWRWLTHKVVS